MIWVLVFAALLNGHAVSGSRLFNSVEECNVAKVELTKSLLEQNVEKAGMTCVSLTIGKLT